SSAGGGLLALLPFAARDDLRYAAAAALRHHARTLLVLQRIECRTHHVVGVRRAQRFGDDVAHAERLEHRAHRSTGDDSSAGGSRADDDLAGPVVATRLMMQRASIL